MSVKKQLVLIPYWVQELLRRKGLELSTCLDFRTMRQVMPLSDLVAFVALQEHWAAFTGIRDYSAGSLVLHWFGQVGPAGAADNQDLSHNVLPLSQDASVRQDLQARLFAASSAAPQYKEPFISYDLTPEFAGAVIYPGFFGESGSNQNLQFQFVRAMLKVLYVYEPHNEVAKTPLFLRYLSLLPM